MGENVQRRVNEMLDEARKLGILVCDSDVAPFRRLIKEQFKPKQELLDKLVTTFLLGRAVPYTIEQVVEQAQKMVDPYADGRRRRPTVAESLDRGDCSLENIPTRN
ncbi:MULTISPECIES: hypothetical protein [Agrobacterium]|jgi:hypothetical protein|uniref:hypothetical protein n=1 Tax=Agrobacterium TaxID=357 RepID=UPI0027874591|nr:hypothetical protein [Agrobacterium sp. SORGH_AS_0745]MDP9759346.1 hypothetical protein [Agrobacterium tumefaciens]MDQ1223774.1 hypothetical protein [Agrobacterium sp. SORGH_AS_0745]